MEALYNKIARMAQDLFPDATSIDHIKKLKEEAQEVISDPSDEEEYADCLIALIAGAAKQGINWNDLKQITYKKVNKNYDRDWKKDSDGVYSHVKTSINTLK